MYWTKKRIIGHTFAWFGIFCYLFWIVFVMWWGQLHPVERYQHMSHWVSIYAWLSYWTYQTNFMLWGFYVFYMVSKYTPKIKVGNRAMIIVSSYMCITMILFWMALFGVRSAPDPEKNITALFSKKYDSWFPWATAFTLHFLATIVQWTIHYFHARNNREKIEMRSWHIKWMAISLIYPVFYLAFVFIHGQIALHFHYVGIEGTLYTKGILANPYYFFDTTAFKGWDAFCGVSGAILIMIFGMQYLLIYLNNRPFIRQKSRLLEIPRNIYTKLSLSFSALVYVIAVAAAVYYFIQGQKIDLSQHKNEAVYIAFYYVHYLEILLFSLLALYAKYTICFDKRKFDTLTMNQIFNIAMIVILINVWYLAIPLLISLILESTAIYPSVKKNNVIY